MRKEPFLRNENPEEIREIIFKCVSKIRENQSDREIHKDVLFELGLLEGRIDQKKFKRVDFKKYRKFKRKKNTNFTSLSKYGIGKTRPCFFGKRRMG